MSWSIRLGRLFGVPVYLHFTFLLLLGLVGLLGLLQGGPVAAASGVVLIASVFGCVVLHEFGHVLAARRYGIPTKDVILLPIGGLARLARMPDEPRQELVVALAGPAVNVGIAGVLFPLASLGAGGFLGQLLAINVVLFLFNMLPAFPMDGGRVLRALLARRMDYVRATDLAAAIGKGMAVLLALAGVFGIPGLWSANPMLLVIGWFVWSGAGREVEMARRSRFFGWSADPRRSNHDVVHEAEVVWDGPSSEQGQDPFVRRRYYRAGPFLVYRDERTAGRDGSSPRE
ncbi:MAG: hypothetical protein GTN89_13690 [Acidobacteria bacterium]|nr:hypothetical protein [Acidobacteriota bacterium]NIM60337.1 hypothetical protein [Acidobacteriota bacterium]NIO60338.1 hypothetical protein [Acidobacteriota bacterium]NIQ31393.1 hypothetical protein [Acidobacteriota bacterium]NIQ86619.1 hypothetical protein [Acidobacteriota bacterium]